jgi:hypothetical protein
MTSIQERLIDLQDCVPKEGDLLVEILNENLKEKLQNWEPSGIRRKHIGVKAVCR